MPELQNQRHERFAAALAKGKSASQSYIDAGYHPCRQNASRLSSLMTIKQRVAEIKETPIAQTETSKADDRDPTTGRFLAGNHSSGGRPRGNRNRLAESFIGDLHCEWEKSGAVALARVAQSDPSTFIRVVSNVLPRLIDTTLNVDVDLYADVKSFAEAFRRARSYIGADDEPPLIEHEDN